MDTPATATAAPIDAHHRATEAAESLAAEGQSVTARAVRQRAGVAMTVAAEAAREWNDRAAAQTAVPAMPDAVQARLEGIWREAYQAAREEFTAEREAASQTHVALQAERDGLLDDVTALETERDALAARATAAEQARADAEAALAAAKTALIAAEATAAGLREALTAIGRDHESI